MKKILLTTALLGATAGAAAAEGTVSFSGYGRFGMNYDSTRANAETRIFQRLRFNINAKTETESGVTFGGRIRLQSDSGRSEATLNTAYVYATYEGFRVEVGNSNAAVDSAALAFNSEIGITDFSAGDPIFVYQEYQSRGFGGNNNRMGVFASYSVGEFNGRVSYIQDNQTDNVTNADEFAISADYKFGAATVSAAYADNAGGVQDARYFFLGAEYGVSDAVNVGVLYFNADDTFDTEDKVTVYANYTVNAITVKGFISSSPNAGIVADSANLADYDEDLAYGIGVDYDLGGARAAFGVQQDFRGETFLDAGVRFDF